MGNEGGQNSWGDTQPSGEAVGLDGRDSSLGSDIQVVELGARARNFEPSDNVVKITETDRMAQAWQASAQRAQAARAQTDENSQEAQGRTIAWPGQAMTEQEQNLTKSALELSEDLNELEYPLETVGEASKLQVAGYLKDDAEDLKNESGKGFVGKLVVTSQEKVAEKMLPKVNKIINQKSYRPTDLMDAYREGRDATLLIFDRKIGDRNNAA